MEVDLKSVKPTSAVPQPIQQHRFRPEVDSKDIIRCFELTRRHCNNKKSCVTNGTRIRLLSSRLQAGNGRIQAMPRLSIVMGGCLGGAGLHCFLHAHVHGQSSSENLAVDTVE